MRGRGDGSGGGGGRGGGRRGAGERPRPPSFEAQGQSFDRRAGLGAEVARGVAEALARAAGVYEGAGAEAPGALVEVGAGTGEIGAPLADAWQGPYVAIEVAARMLERFAARLDVAPGAGRGRALLVRGDACRPWPLRAGSAACILLSRTAHLLPPEHLAGEITRVAAARPAALLALGRVRRDPRAPRAVLRDRLHHLLRARGFAPREGREGESRVVDAVIARGWRWRPPRIAARWRTAQAPATQLAAWRGKPGLAGLDLPPVLQREVLDALEAWAGEALGDLAVEVATTEEYVLTLCRRGDSTAGERA